MKKILFFFLLLFSQQNIFAQLPDSSIAPNWILPDTDGANHELYAYLNQGKTVFIDFFATWCVPCWNYHETHSFLDLYKQHGPTGTLTQEVMCFAIEQDLNTHLLDLHGSTGGTQGNWMHLTKYPVLDLTSDTVSTAYEVHYLPLIYAICPDKRIFHLQPLGADDLYAQVAQCNGTTSTQIADFEENIQVYPNPSQENLFISGEGKFGVRLYNVLGECIWQKADYQANTLISVKDFPKGIYFLHLSVKDKKLIRKVVIGN
jgi:hypothetical protein